MAAFEHRERVLVTFGEVEHDGDLHRCEEAVSMAGGQVIESGLGMYGSSEPCYEEGYVLAMVPGDVDEFVRKVRDDGESCPQGFRRLKAPTPKSDGPQGLKELLRF